MNKLIYFTDGHIYDKDVSSRLDRSSLAVLDKLAYIRELGAKHKVDAFVSGGDLTTGNIESNSYIRKVLSVFASMREIAPVFTVIGNHDVPYTNVFDYNQWLLGILESAGLLNVPYTSTTGEPQGISQYFGDGVLFAHAYADSILKDPASLGIDPLKVKTIFAHHYIGYGSDRLSLYPETVKKTFPNLKSIFSGHDHKVYRTTEFPCGVTSYRPGGLLRTAMDETQTRDEVNCMLVDLDHTGEVISATYLPIVVAPAGSIFPTTARLISKATVASVEAFVQDFAQANQAQADDLATMLRESIASIPDDEVRTFLEKDSYSMQVNLTGGI